MAATKTKFKKSPDLKYERIYTKEVVDVLKTLKSFDNRLKKLNKKIKQFDDKESYRGRCV